MLAATAMGLRLCGIFAQKQKPPADPHSFHTIPYSMKGLAAATLVSMRPAIGAATHFAKGEPHLAREMPICTGSPPLAFIADLATTV